MKTYLLNGDLPDISVKVVHLNKRAADGKRLPCVLFYDLVTNARPTTCGAERQEQGAQNQECRAHGRKLPRLSQFSGMSPKEPTTLGGFDETGSQACGIGAHTFSEPLFVRGPAVIDGNNAGTVVELRMDESPPVAVVERSATP
jgi:hypothetical protein